MNKVLLIILIILLSLNAQALFEVKDASDHSVFEITNDGIRIFNYPDTLMIISSAEIRANLDNSKGLSRSFSVSTNATGKGGGDVVNIDADGLRVYNGIDKLMDITGTNITAYIDSSSTKGLSRSFSVSTNATGKAEIDILNVTTETTKMREGTHGNQYTDFSEDNIFLGLNSGINTTPLNETMGENNVFLGNESGHTNTTGAANVFLGYKSGYSNDTGFRNCFIGQESGFTNYSGRDNVFIGHESGYLNYDGDFNVFLGYIAGSSNTSGSRNVFIGYESGAYSGSGSGNTFVGETSGYMNGDGYGNSYFGRSAAASIVDGHYNTIMGFESSLANQAGEFNSCFGAESGKLNYLNGSSNSLFGYRAGYGTDVPTNTYNNNSFFGTESGFSTTTGSNNSYFGYQSGYSVTTGYGNVFLGYQAGYNETGSELLYIDNSTTTQPLIWGDFDGDIVKINGEFSVTSHTDLQSLHAYQTLEVDGTATFNGTRASIIHPIGQTTNGLFIQSTYNSNTDSWHFYQSTGDNLTLWYNTTLRGTWDLTSGVYTSSSDKKFKKNIEELAKVMDKVMLLQPKKYNFISQKNNDDKYIGLIAQDVEKLFPEFVMYNEEADAYTMDYAGLSVIAIQAIKEQQEKIEQLEIKIDELSSLQSEIEEIKKLLNK